MSYIKQNRRSLHPDLPEITRVREVPRILASASAGFDGGDGGETRGIEEFLLENCFGRVDAEERVFRSENLNLSAAGGFFFYTFLDTRRTRKLTMRRRD